MVKVGSNTRTAPVAQPVAPATSSPVATPSSNTPADAFGNSGPTGFTKQQSSAANLGRSTKLFDAVLTSDKSKLLSSLGPEAQKQTFDRELAKRVGLALATTPYAAPFEVIQERLLQDPLIAAKLPGANLVDLRLLNEQFPEIVPLPSLPIDFGSTSVPSLDAYLDFFANKFFEAVGVDRFSLVQQRYNQNRTMRGHKDAKDLRYLVVEKEEVSSWGRGITASHRSGAYVTEPTLNGLMNRVGPYREKLGLSGIFLRRVIDNAPPTWGPEQIAAEHNRYLDFYGAALFSGDKDTYDKAKERARMTPERVTEIMAKAPLESGAQSLAKRQEILRNSLAQELENAKPSENLYAILTRVCDRVAENSKALAQQNRDPSRGYGRENVRMTPRVEASLTPEDLASFVAGDPMFAPKLDSLLSSRNEGLDKSLAKFIAAKLGTRMERMSVTEIARVMAKEDPAYTEPVVRHLITTFPEVFKGKKVERSSIEANFLLANQLASVMDKMFKGATLDDVASFMKSENPDLAAMYPDFSGEDIKLLQSAYDFVPKWAIKEQDTLLPTTSTSMPLDAFAKLATKQLGSERAVALQKLIFQHLRADFSGDTVPPEILRQIDHDFRCALLGFVAKALGVHETSGGLGKPDMDMAGQLSRFINGHPDAANAMNEGSIERVLTFAYGRSAGEAQLTAKALMSAHKLDFLGLQQHLEGLFLGKSNAENVLLKLDALALAYEGLGARLERDIFRNEELKASFKRSARIPFSLPMIQAVVDKYKGEKPLANQNVLMVQHMLGQAYPQVSGYSQLGMNAENAIFVGIPYHKNHEVEDALVRSFGIDVRVPPKDMVKLYEAIEKAVDDIVKKHKENGQPMLIVCDGPQARDYFKKKYPDLVGKASFTEQTAFGDRPEQRADKSIRVVSYARTELKAKKEAKFIAQAVARAVNAVLTKLGTGYEQKPVLIMGLGPIGMATSEAFIGDRAEVFAYDPNLTPAMRAEAEKMGVKVVTDPKNITAGKFMVIGCSGHRSIDEEQILASDPNSVYVSASSKLVEINMKRLSELATDEEGRLRKVLAAEVNNQQTWHYWLKDGTIRTVVADGLPANFNDVNSVPPEFIDMTMGMSLAAAVQTVKSDEKGFYGLNDTDHDMLNQVFEGMLEKMRKDAELQGSIEAKVEARLGS